VEQRVIPKKPMERLTIQDHRRLLDCVAGLHEHDDLNRLKSHLPATITEVVQADVAMFADFDLRRRNTPIYQSHPAHAFTFEPEFIACVYQEHPCVKHIAKTGYLKALKITDFLSQRQYRQTALYSEGMRRYGVEYNMGFQVVEPCLPEITSISLVRKNRDFSETDRLKLNLLRPHIARAYIAVRQMTELRAQANITFEALAAAKQGIIALAADGSISFCTEAARGCLKAYFGQARGDILPPGLSRWLHLHEVPAGRKGSLPRLRSPFVVEGNQMRLTVHLLSGGAGRQRLLRLQEEPVKLSSESLQIHLGLTLRQAEVLLWVSQGKTGPEIATILGLSAGTIRKHTEHIFDKLGVETRTAAAIQAREAIERGLDGA
jgi:DNA-binding CsgD family transcriptional regulator